MYIQKLETFGNLVSACLSVCLPFVCSVAQLEARRYVCECCNSLAVLQQDETKGRKERTREREKGVSVYKTNERMIG